MQPDSMLGLHACAGGLQEVRRLEKLRAKRAFEASLPAIDDVARLPERQAMIEAWEVQEWMEREEEIKGVQEERLSLLAQALQVCNRCWHHQVLVLCPAWSSRHVICRTSDCSDDGSSCAAQLLTPASQLPCSLVTQQHTVLLQQSTVQHRPAPHYGGRRLHAHVSIMHMPACLAMCRCVRRRLRQRTGSRCRSAAQHSWPPKPTSLQPYTRSASRPSGSCQQPRCGACIFADVVRRKAARNRCP